MPLRQTMLQGVDTTLTFDVPDSGHVTSATVDIYDANGQVLVAAANATVTETDGEPTRLSYLAVGATVAPSLVENLRARWGYVIDGVTRRRNMTFDVVLAQIYPTLVTAAQLAGYYPLLAGRDFPGATGQVDLIAKAWVDLLDRIRASGKNPNRMIDPAPLEPAHAALAAGYIARNYKPGSPQSSDWQAWAAEQLATATASLNEILANYPWYDETEDLVPSVTEQHVGLRTIRLSR